MHRVPLAKAHLSRDKNANGIEVSLNMAEVEQDSPRSRQLPLIRIKTIIRTNGLCLLSACFK